MFKAYLHRVVEGKHLGEEDAFEAMCLIMEGKALPTQIASFLTALRMKGETPEEITGLARAMRAQALPIRYRGMEKIVDTCGTGGDGKQTFNISTAVAFVAAAAGLKVGKHGNRSVSSLCGSADVLEALGVRIDLSPSKVEACLETVGIAFLFAPLFHPAMRHAIGPRKEIGFRTVFNLLGPLTNPVGPKIQVVGVCRKELLPLMTQALERLGTREALVVHGEDGCDEVSVAGRTWVNRLQEGRIVSLEIEPEALGLRRRTLEEIRGGEAKQNAKMFLDVLKGKPGPPRDAVLLNAAAVFLAAGFASEFREGIEMAKDVIDSGRALERLNALIEFTTRCSQSPVEGRKEP